MKTLHKVLFVASLLTFIDAISAPQPTPPLKTKFIANISNTTASPITFRIAKSISSECALLTTPGKSLIQIDAHQSLTVTAVIENPKCFSVDLEPDFILHYMDTAKKEICITQLTNNPIKLSCNATAAALSDLKDHCGLPDKNAVFDEKASSDGKYSTCTFNIKIK